MNEQTEHPICVRLDCDHLATRMPTIQFWSLGYMPGDHEPFEINVPQLQVCSEHDPFVEAPHFLEEVYGAVCRLAEMQHKREPDKATYRVKWKMIRPQVNMDVARSQIDKQLKVAPDGVKITVNGTEHVVSSVVSYDDICDLAFPYRNKDILYTMTWHKRRSNSGGSLIQGETVAVDDNTDFCVTWTGNA